MNNLKRILVLGAGFYYLNVFKELKALGYRVLAVDRDPSAPGYAMADEHQVVDISDRAKILAYAKSAEIDGIMAINDFGVRTACYVAQKLGLPGNTIVTGICANDKGIMRDIWAHEQIPQPRYQVIGTGRDELEFAADRIHYPLVVKPTDCGGGGRGVSTAHNKNELVESASFAQPFSKNGRLIVEEYIEGTEMTIDALSYKGEIFILAMSDKEKAAQRYRVATSLNFPPRVPEAILKEVDGITRKAIFALGIINGASHTEVIVQKDGSIKVVELGARGGGGHIFHTIVKESTGINYAQECAKILCGDIPDFSCRQNSGVVYRFFNPPQGIIREIQIPPGIRDLPYVVDFSVTAKVGQRFDGLKDSLHRIGFVVTRGKNTEEAIQNANIIESAIRFIIEP